MPKINNSEIIKNIINEAKINIQVEKVPTQLAEKIVPVLIVKSAPEKLVRTIEGACVDATTTVVTTVSTTRVTYITGGSFTNTKDVNSTSTYTAIKITAFGQPETTLSIARYEPLTAGSQTQVFTLSVPIRLEKGSEVRLLNSSAVASIDSSVILYLYEVEE